MSSTTTVFTAGKKCVPFLLQVMVFSPESGYKFTIEVQKACASDNSPVWKLLFDLNKNVNGTFVQVVSVNFVAGDPNDIQKIAAITEEGMKRPQVRAFREQVYPLVKPFGEQGTQPNEEDSKAIHDTIKAAIHAA